MILRCSRRFVAGSSRVRSCRRSWLLRGGYVIDPQRSQARTTAANFRNLSAGSTSAIAVCLGPLSPPGGGGSYSRLNFAPRDYAGDLTPQGAAAAGRRLYRRACLHAHTNAIWPTAPALAGSSTAKQPPDKTWVGTWVKGAEMACFPRRGGGGSVRLGSVRGRSPKSQ